MSNLLLITDAAHIQQLFNRLTGDDSVRLRTVSSLERGGEEIAIEKPDIVFVQTHLSGFSPEISLMHLKKQLGRKRSRFVLLAPPDQAGMDTLKLYQGWLDSSKEENSLFADLEEMISSLLSKPKKVEVPTALPGPVSSVESSALLGVFSARPKPPEPQQEAPPPVPIAPPPEPSLEDLGITYAPRQRLQVYSEFNSSFDSAVSNTPAPAPLEVEPLPPPPPQQWNEEIIEIADPKPPRRRRVIFALCLIPLVIVAVAVTYLQQGKPAPKSSPAPPVVQAPVTPVTPPPASPVDNPSAPTQPPTPAPAAISPPVAPAAAPAPAAALAYPAKPAAAPPEQEKLSDKAVLSAIAGNRPHKDQAGASPPAGRLTVIPDFIPRAGLDRKFAAANPGWERYKGKVTEFKVLREGEQIKAIQVIDQGGNGVPESFMHGVLKQVTRTPQISIETSEKQEGYLIQRGKLADNIKIVYYRDEESKKLRAFVMTWQ